MRLLIEHENGKIVPLTEHHLESAFSQADLDKFMITKKLREENDRLTARVEELEGAETVSQDTYNCVFGERGRLSDIVCDLQREIAELKAGTPLLDRDKLIKELRARVTELEKNASDFATTILKKTAVLAEELMEILITDFHAFMDEHRPTTKGPHDS